LAVYLSATCPVVVAPAMDEDMWQHPATQENIQKIKANGNQVIPVEKGELASGLIGEGRMAEPEEIVRYLQEHFFLTQPLHGKKALVTAGPTYEPIDPVRFIGNRSSGKMGWAIANELKNRGAAVTLILGPSHLNIEPNGILVEKVNTADEMYAAAWQNFATADITIMAAAVADYTPEHPENEKIKKNNSTLQIQLTKTKDILKSLGQQKTKQQVLVGFALETNDEEKFAKQKLIEKNADLIVLNSLKDEGAGFGVDTNKITIFEKNGQVFRFDQQPKNIVAKDIIDTLIKLYYD
ncbi:MAG TPA: bifunctional phosphopantothenoylcysteine decarboxylase/phosphopantothenate--cysteine ligase CoaBC, partial [Chitinophagaceae bacterium]|nr:bifunctional phosphopantothenoylcysteine decarboxylase/phosphopantothenate--cysteine ligase CoaBC [Chitinophagaceae bacterium]